MVETVSQNSAFIWEKSAISFFWMMIIILSFPHTFEHPNFSRITAEVSSFLFTNYIPFLPSEFFENLLSLKGSAFAVRIVMYCTSRQVNSWLRKHAIVDLIYFAKLIGTRHVRACVPLRNVKLLLEKTNDKGNWCHKRLSFFHNCLTSMSKISVNLCSILTLIILA